MSVTSSAPDARPGRLGPDADAFLFAYFVGQARPDSEQVYFAISELGDGLHYTSLNSSQPVLTSDVGESGVRDPFLVRNRLTDRFHVLATDLRVYPDSDWSRAQHFGSRDIVIFDSDDLVSWSPPRTVTLSGPEAGCTWAPEAFFDADADAYVVIWASSLFDDVSHAGETYQRMMYSLTRDFASFTPPEIYIDRGCSVIDATLLQHAGVTYRFSKDERARDAEVAGGKLVFEERGRRILDDNFQLIRRGIGTGFLDHGEGPIAFKAPGADLWYLFIDEFDRRGYVAFSTTDLDSGAWTPVVGAALPPGARHGSVLPISAAERRRLLHAYGSPTGGSGPAG
ncbi:MAG: glycoside hydrolase family 43 protein [Janthinobacterium lividum]